MTIVTMKQLLEVGVHFGHQTKKWNPKMKKYIYTDKSGIYIIDLQKTLKLLLEAHEYIRKAVSEGGIVLFVGTKKQTQDIIESYAQECGMPYVRNRWLGGTLTNFETISKRTKRIDEIEEMEKSGIFEKLPKKEVLGIKKEYEKLLFNIGGIRDMKKLPDVLYVIDPNKEIIAVREARKLNIPIVAITDTNCDPDMVDFIIPGNDDAIRSCNLLTSVICDAVKIGKEEQLKMEIITEEKKKTEEKKAEEKKVAEKKVEVKEQAEKKVREKKPVKSKTEEKKPAEKKVEKKKAAVKKTSTVKAEEKKSRAKKPKAGSKTKEKAKAKKTGGSKAKDSSKDVKKTKKQV